jgi:hypothetical protein
MQGLRALPAFAHRGAVLAWPAAQAAMKGELKMEDMDLLRESKDSGYRFVVVFKDMHILKEWDITQQVVINDDVGYMQYLIGTFPTEMKEYLVAFVKLFLRALEDIQNGKDDAEDTG